MPNVNQDGGLRSGRYSVAIATLLRPEVGAAVCERVWDIPVRGLGLTRRVGLRGNTQICERSGIRTLNTQ